MFRWNRDTRDIRSKERRKEKETNKHLGFWFPLSFGFPLTTFPHYRISDHKNTIEEEKGGGKRRQGAVEMKKGTSLGVFAIAMALVIVFTMRIQYEHLRMEARTPPFFGGSNSNLRFNDELVGLPRGIVESTSDLEMKPLWQSDRTKRDIENTTALLAIAVGITQKENVDLIVRKFLLENYSVILFHYDGNVDGWNDLEWSREVIHILAQSQTKWWFAKRFLHPDVVSIYDYIFLWDEDLGVEYFHPTRYLQLVTSERLEISQPALDPDSPEVHHRITVRNSKRKVHRRVYDFRGSLNCSDKSTGPPCTGWVEGMAPVFSQSAWRCVWHLIQNDLIHGWGLDMKLGYCAQGDRTKNVGVIDSEFVIHKGIPSLGGSSTNKLNRRSIDLRTHIRRQSTAELDKFKKRWEQAVQEDSEWNDPFERRKKSV